MITPQIEPVERCQYPSTFMVKDAKVRYLYESYSSSFIRTFKN